MPNRTGDVVLADFPGAQQGKRRPGIIVSTALYHQSRPDVVVALCTTQLAKAVDPTDYILQDWQTAGLLMPTAVRMNFTTPAQRKVLATLGRLTDRDWQEVQARMRLALAVV